MAAQEDEAQHVVVPRDRFVSCGVRPVSHRDCFLLRAAAVPTAGVDRLVAGDADDPPHRVGGDAVDWPLGHGGCAGVLHRVFGGRDVSGDAAHRCDRRPPVLPDDVVERGAHVEAGTATTGRITTEASLAAGIVAAHLIASSRSAHSISA